MKVKTMIQTRSTKCQYRPDDLDHVVGGRRRPPRDRAEDGEEIDDAAGDVQTVEAGDDEEGGPEQRGAPGIAVDVQPPMDEVRPLVGLQAHEDGAAQRGVEENFLQRSRSPLPSHSSAFTIVTLEQISRNVMSAVRLIPST